ncbi:MAG: DUF4954 family protein [Clostridium sp.]|nr:DUF4954 family protein [Bacteroides sp.]MCM1199369.1 DUF4954 family protein [Clostridium sp.]
MGKYRFLETDEVARLKAQMCTAADWSQIEVAEEFSTEYVHYARFSGFVRIGSFYKSFELAGGMTKHSGIYHATLHNVSIGDDCCIENVKNYIANYSIGNDTFIENVDIILTDGVSTFGNGVEVSVLNETGGREVMVYDRLSAQQAYIMALYRHRPELIARMRAMIGQYVDSVASSVGRIGSHVMIADAGYIKNVNIGDYCKIEGTARLKNGSINSNVHAPVHVGVGVIGDDFIISSGSSVEDGVTFSRCFIGQACRLGHTYSATDSLFFSNCQGENGEACAIFAGPFTVTHHKSTLLIAGMFSFMNAGSGSNQSNHMYKLGPIHQGIMERGAKTSSDSYLLWPAKIGAFSLVMGRHVTHQDTSDLPFSYLIEQQSTSYLIPGVNLKSVGTIRDAKKWPKRDMRTDPDILDCINYNLLSPFTIQKMLKGRQILRDLRRVSGETSDTYSFQSAKIKSSSLKNGIRFYEMAISKFLGNSLIKRLEGLEFDSDEDMRGRLRPDCHAGSGQWVDVSGMIAPKSEVEALLDDIENGVVTDMEQVHGRFCMMHSMYYDYEWTWAYSQIADFYSIDMESITAADVVRIVEQWKDAVSGLDRMVYEDARKEFSLSSMTGFGVDGDRHQRRQDFEEVRGGQFDSNPFVVETLDHIRIKMALGDELIGRLRHLV